jgi:hypothetical protein
MAALLEVAAFLAVFDDGDGLVAAFLDELGGYFGTREVWCADLSIGAIVGQENLIKLDDIPCFARSLGGNFFDLQDAVLRDNVLLPAGLYDCNLGHKFVFELDNYNPYPPLMQIGLVIAAEGVELLGLGLL